MPQDNLRDGTTEGKALFAAFGALAEGHIPDMVISAAMNLVLSAIRQSTARRASALEKLDELFGRSASALMEHYDASTGRRRSVVPFDQVVSVAHVEFPTTFGRLGRKNGRT